MVVWEVVRFFFLNMQNTTSTVQTGKRKDLTARGARGKAASTALGMLQCVVAGSREPNQVP